MRTTRSTPRETPEVNAFRHLARQILQQAQEQPETADQQEGHNTAMDLMDVLAQEAKQAGLHQPAPHHGWPDREYIMQEVLEQMNTRNGHSLNWSGVSINEATQAAPALLAITTKRAAHTDMPEETYDRNLEWMNQIAIQVMKDLPDDQYNTLSAFIESHQEQNTGEADGAIEKALQRQHPEQEATPR